MTLFSRVATVAAVTFSLATSLVTSSPVQANGLDVTALTRALLQQEQPAPGMVPAVEPVAPAEPLAVEPITAELAATESESFDTLADAVAAQDVTAEDEAMRCLAGAIYFESKGEPLSGQLAVAEVILNRAKSGRYPPDVCGVVKQRGQFGFVRGGRIPSINEGARAWRTAVAVARVALNDVWGSAAGKALYFNTPGRAPGARLTRVAMIGNHVFYR